MYVDQTVYVSVAEASASSIPANVRSLETQFYNPTYTQISTLVGGACYCRVSKADIDAGSYHVNTYFRSVDRVMPDGSTDATNGGYWLLSDPEIDPRACGAKGDGITNDNAAFVAAFSLKRPVRLRKGTYCSPVALSLPSGAQIIGDPGAEIKMTAIVSSHAIFLNGVSDVAIEGLKLQGSNVPGVNGIYADNCSNIIIKDCALDKFGTGDDAAATTTAGIWIHVGCTDVTIKNNELTGGTGKNNGHDIIVYATSGEAIVSGNRCYSPNSNGIYTNAVNPLGRLVITGNITKNHKRHGICPVYGGTAQHWVDQVACATTANIVLSGEQTIDGVTTAASRVLVMNQMIALENGIYLSGAGTWTRATDADNGVKMLGAAAHITGGTTLSGQSWVCTTAGPITVGTTALSFARLANDRIYRADCVVSDNVCVDCDSTGIYINSDLSGFTVTGNIVYSCSGGGTNGYTLDGGIVAIGAGHKIIANNYIANSGKTSNGATRVIDTAGVTNDPTRVCAIRMNATDHCIVQGNIIDGSTGRGINVYGGATGSQVIENTVLNCALASIYIESMNVSGEFWTIKGNTINQSLLDGYGIWHRGGTVNDNVQITGNVLVGKKGTTSKSGLRLEGGGTVGRISGNEFRNWDVGLDIANAAITALMGATLIVDDNMFSGNTSGLSYIGTTVAGLGFHYGNTFSGNSANVTDTYAQGALLSALSVWPRKVIYATAAPASGAWAVGDRAINSAPAVGQPKAWTCTASGAPGTWTSEGNL